MENENTATFFNIFFSGQLESAQFPLGPDALEIFCRFTVNKGPDWELVSGCENGITQMATNGNGNFNDKIVFNMPIELTYKSTSPFGWPQMLISVYGRKRWGVETSLGYARVTLPVLGADKSSQRLVAPILIPKCSNMISEMSNWIAGKNAELKNPSILMDNTKAKGLSVESYGEVQLNIMAISRGTGKLGYDWA